METRSRIPLLLHRLGKVASLLGSGINGNTEHQRGLVSAVEVASLLGSGINGNLDYKVNCPK
mgnify:CR=1 FL=1